MKRTLNQAHILSMKPAEILPVDADLVDKAATALKAGELVIFPTETVYGVGADAGNGGAVAKIYEIKGRPANKAIIVHVADSTMAARYVEWTDAAEKLAATFWPGPLTLVLKRKGGIGARELADGDTLAVRAPANPMAQQLIKALGGGLAGSSANRSGEPSPVMCEQAQAALGENVLALDGGPCTVGLASTVLDMTQSELTILREGAISLQDINACLHGSAASSI